MLDMIFKTKNAFGENTFGIFFSNELRRFSRIFTFAVDFFNFEYWPSLYLLNFMNNPGIF